MIGSPSAQVALAGVSFVFAGGALAIYHIHHLIKEKDSGDHGETLKRIGFAIFGGLLISMGANLMADSIHDTIKSSGA
jgi:hypothetical protein